MQKPKNIVICCDGTSNKFGNKLTNVVKAYSVMSREGQVLYYDPGVGTMADIHVLSGIKKQFIKFIGLGFGYGLKHNVLEAYTFLMKNYVVGDKVFLFGFSRGAYTVRVIAGFIQLFGLLDEDNEQHAPYAYELYSSKNLNITTGFEFQNTYTSRKCEFHFMGLWDSVSSVGSIGSMRNYPYTTSINNVKTIRHALAVDEMRAYFRHNLIKSENGTDKKEVWFPGVHGDVGGGNLEMNSGQAKIALAWMVREAKLAGLKLNQDRYTEVVEGLTIARRKPKTKFSQLDPSAPLHKNNFFVWGLLELIPRREVFYRDNKRQVKWYFPWFRRRKIMEGALLHESIEIRKNEQNYGPSNLPSNYEIEK